MKLTSQMIKDKARELGIDCIAIGNIERFKDAPKLMSPLTYFPNAKSVIAVAMRIPRGTYRGIEEGTIIEISVQKPGQEKLTSNIKVMQSDLDLLQGLKDLGNM